jgi:hypothetical protein
MSIESKWSDGNASILIAFNSHTVSLSSNLISENRLLRLENLIVKVCENWYIMLGEHSSEGRDFGISRMDKKGMEIAATVHSNR